MNRFFLQDKRDGRVRMICDNDKGEFDATLFDLIKIDISKKQEDDIKQGKQKAVIEKGGLKLVNFND
jgi:hypothetical protein